MTLFHRAGLPQNVAVDVPFAGLAPALTALLAGNVQFMITSTGAATPAHRQRQAAPARGDQPQAVAAAARRADHGGARLCQLRGRSLVRLGGAGRDARDSRRALERARERGAARSQAARSDLGARLRNPRRHGRAVRRFHCRSTSADTRSSPRIWAWPRIERLTTLKLHLPLRCMARATCAEVLCLLPRPRSARRRPPRIQAPSWIIPDLVAAARAEGSLTVYSSMNEQEGLPLWKMFEDGDRREGELCALVRLDHSLAHRDREPRPAAQLGPRGHHHGEPAAQRRAAAIRSAAGARAHPAGARPRTAAGTGSTPTTTRPPTTPAW